MTTSGWVKSTTASTPAATRSWSGVAEVDLGHELEVVGGLDRPADLRPDLAAGS